MSKNGGDPSITIFIVDYDLDMVRNSERRQFYRCVHKFLKHRNVTPETWSTQSVLVTEDLEFAEFVYASAIKLGHAHIYEAKRIK